MEGGATLIRRIGEFSCFNHMKKLRYYQVQVRGHTLHLRSAVLGILPKLGGSQLKVKRDAS